MFKGNGLVIGTLIVLAAGCTSEADDTGGAAGAGNAGGSDAGGSDGGEQPGNGPSSDVSLSDDGRFMAFASLSDNLVPGDTNGEVDVFVYDRNTGVNTRVSVSSTGEQGDENSSNTAISGDGRYVTFTTYSLTFSSHDPDGFSQVYLHDRETGTTERVCTGLYSDVSDDGRFVSCGSWGSIVVDRATGERHELAESGGFVSLSGDGGIAVYEDEDLDRVVIRELSTGVETEIEEVAGRELHNRPRISADGHYVVFSAAENVGPDSHVSGVYRYDRTSGTSELIYEATRPGDKSDSLGPRATISGDGSRIAFMDEQFKTLLADGGPPRLLETGETTLMPYLSANGEWLAYPSAFGTEQAYLHEIATGESKLVSKSSE